MKILVTGVSGYIGRAVAAEAVRQGVQTLGLVRSKPQPPLLCPFLIPSSWQDPVLLAKAMEGCNAVIHCAGLAHGKDGDMRDTNVRLTRTLAEAALHAGVKRFVFLSSAAVFGQKGRHALADAPIPSSAYGQSKLDSERLLIQSGLAVSIIRPPMIVGKGAPGRAASLRRWSKYPLPFGRLRAERAYMKVDEITGVILAEAANSGPSVLVHPNVHVVTATDLVRVIAQTDGYTPKLFPFPAFLLKWGGERFKPLTETHILESGRRDLDRIV